ncbi:MAG: 8-amino-7-oxononanoate synthase [Nocardioidaceae bacterium]
MMTALDGWLAEQAAGRKAAGLVRRLAPRRSDQNLLDLAGNDYLGLSGHPRVVAAAVAAAGRWGAGATASRLVTGSLTLHTELERELAAFTGRERALVFSSGYLANLGVLTALADEDTLLVSDAHVHASLVDACRLARGDVRVMAHCDAAAVESVLAARTQPRALVVIESVYSVLGDAAPLPELATVCARHDATLLVDEAHGLGVAGPGGRGLVASLPADVAKRVVLTVTLSKALGAQGGAVLGPTAVIEHLVNAARPFIFDTALAPTSAAAALEALTMLQESPCLADAARTCAGSLAAAAGMPAPAAAVLSVPMPSPEAALAAQAAAAERGVEVGAFRPPSVPDGVSRLRLTARADLDATALAHAVEVVREVVRAVVA